MQLKFLFFILSVLLADHGFSQKRKSVAFYNVENLFDTINQANLDEEFLPSADKGWNTAKYTEKLIHIRQVMDHLQYPLIVGFAEVENKGVLLDLIKVKKMKRYGIVHYDSEDARGIDVGLLYNKKCLKVLTSRFLRFPLPNNPEAKTRDILYVLLESKTDKFHVLVNHWPSRRGGTEQSEPKRLAAANTALHCIDSIQKINPQAKIIFMGDLNDTPKDKSAQSIAERLVPMITEKSGTHHGSHQYRGNWDILDHILVSSSCFEGKHAVQKESGKIQEFDFLLETYKGNIQPFRTYVGKKYLGGYSDHLPVSIDLK